MSVPLKKAHLGFNSQNILIIHRYEYQDGINYTYIDSQSRKNFIILSQFSTFPEFVICKGFLKYKNFRAITRESITYPIYLLKDYIDYKLQSLNLENILKNIIMKLVKLVNKLHEHKISNLRISQQEIFVREDKILMYFPSDMHCCDWVIEKNTSSPVCAKYKYEQDFQDIGFLIAEILNVDIKRNLMVSRDQYKKIIEEKLRAHPYQNIVSIFKDLILNYILIDDNFRDVYSVKIHLDRNYKCIWCDSDRYSIGNPKMTMDCGHFCHKTCFNKEMTIVFILAKNYKQLCCPGNYINLQCRVKNISYCNCKVNCVCPKKTECKCKKPDPECRCKNNTCKYIKKSCYCKKINTCQCLPQCKCKILSIEFFKKYWDELNFSILRKMILLYIAENSTFYYRCRTCNHVAYYLILNKQLKAYIVECPCGKKGPCSFCRDMYCFAKKCSKLREYLTTVSCQDPKEVNLDNPHEFIEMTVKNMQSSYSFHGKSKSISTPRYDKKNSYW